jgi:hypothetical protein
MSHLPMRGEGIQALEESDDGGLTERNLPVPVPVPASDYSA